MLRSIIAVVAGFLFVVVLAVAADAILLTTWPSAFGPTGGSRNVAVLALTLAYTAVFAAAGAYVTAWLAPYGPLRHALALGAISLAISAIAVIGAWDSAPPWYHVVALVQVVPMAWIGGWLRQRQTEPPAAPAQAI
jgi:hypothetical protein